MEYRYLDENGLTYLVQKNNGKYATIVNLGLETDRATGVESGLDARLTALELDPAYGDAIQLFDNKSKFPAKGNEQHLYVALDTGSIYQYRVINKEESTTQKGYVLVGVDVQRIEEARAKAAEEKLTTKTTSLQNQLSTEASLRSSADEALSGRLDTAESKLVVIQGDETIDGSIKKALSDAKSHTADSIDALKFDEIVSDGSYVNKISQTSGKISAELKEAVKEASGITSSETNLVQAKAINEYVESVKTDLTTSISGVSDRVTATEGRLDIVQGDDTVTGSIANAVKAEETRSTGVESGLNTRVETLEGKTKLSAFEDDLSYNSENPEESTLKHNHDHVYFKKENIITAKPEVDPWDFTAKDKVISAELSSDIERRVFNLETGGAGEVRGVYLDDVSVIEDHEARIKSSNIKTLNRIYQVTELPESGEKYADYVLTTGTLPYSVYRWQYFKATEEVEPAWQWKEVCKSNDDGMPLVGDSNKLYKTSENRVFHCYYTSEGETQVINWLEVGRNNLVVVNTKTELPESGALDKVYFVIDEGKLYQWNGTQYKEISGGTSEEIKAIKESITSLQNDVAAVRTTVSVHTSSQEELTHGLTADQLQLVQYMAQSGKGDDYKTQPETDYAYFTHKGAYNLYTELNTSKLSNTDAVFDVNYDTSENIYKLTKRVWDKTQAKKVTEEIVNLKTLKEDLKLNNVNNTADADKPISTATSTALGLKIDKSSIANDLTTTDTSKVLAAPQGIELKNLITSAISEWTGLASALTFKGTVYAKEPAADDPTGATYLSNITGQKVGDFYQTTKDSKSYGWNGTDWLELSAVITIKDYIATASEVSKIVSDYGNY